LPYNESLIVQRKPAAATAAVVELQQQLHISTEKSNSSLESKALRRSLIVKFELSMESETLC
jgi:hypothetical protein